MEVLDGGSPADDPRADTTQPNASVPASEVLLMPAVPPDQRPARVYLVRLGAGSRRTMQVALETMAALLSGRRCDADTLDWSQLRYQHTCALRAALAARYQPATANKHLAALRGVLREAWQLGQMTAEQYHRAANLRTVRATTLPRGRALGPGELRALFRVCREDQRASGVRDSALLAVLYGAGLRRSEVVALDVTDYDRDTGALTVRAGKGRKDRIGYGSNGSRAALVAWLQVRGGALGPLFWPIDQAARMVARRMTAQSVFEILRRRAGQAGVSRFSPHDLRRTFISDLLDAGADISTVAGLAGHANVQTTARYDRRGEHAKRRSAELLVVPFDN
jgi:site-specific recombinase XerD